MFTMVDYERILSATLVAGIKAGRFDQTIAKLRHEGWTFSPEVEAAIDERLNAPPQEPVS